MFDANDYQKLAMRTSPEGHDRMMNGCMGLIGESGEVVDAVKKWKFQSGKNPPIPQEKLIDELGDVLWYCAELATGMHLDMMKAKEQWGFDGLSYHGSLSIEALFLSKLAQNMADACFSPDEFTPSLDYIIASIIDLVGYMLHNYCDCTLERCMEQNIEKLKKRYPDGFDPERSLHREE